MRFGYAHRIAGYLFVLVFAITPALAQTDGPGGTTAKLLAPAYRTPDGFWNKTSREARIVQDEMLAHKGADNILNAFDADRFANRADFAEHWAKERDEVKFRDILRQLERERDGIEARANQIETLRGAVSEELDSELIRWRQLLAGSSIEAHFAKAFGIEIGGTITSKFLGWLGGKISSKVASVIVTGTGKAIGPISTLVSLYQFFEAYDEYAEMKLMLDRLLERVEMIAYLDVLVKKYDGVIATQDKVIDELIMSYASYSRNACR